MDQGLFIKHLKAVQERGSIKESLVQSIFEETGVQIDLSEVTILKKAISITTSSVKRMQLTKKGVKALLESKGFTLTF